MFAQTKPVQSRELEALAFLKDPSKSTDVVCCSVGKMVLKNVWVPALDADPRDGFERAPLNTENGQHYSVESGSDPYYPRGAVMPISSFSADTPPDEDDDDENNDFNEETSVHPHHMERRLRDLVLCGVSFSICELLDPTHSFVLLSSTVPLQHCYDPQKPRDQLMAS